MVTKAVLIAFEADIAAEFEAGHIRAPVHLEGGNEDALINIFQHVQPNDWICTTWRSHLKCLLRGVPPERLKADILAGKSITLCYPEYHIISSAIVAGICPIALGLAWAAKRNNTGECVWLFCGDMTARTGLWYECFEYARGHNLPIEFIVEDNGVSVLTPTAEVWGNSKVIQSLMRYEFTPTWPHSGIGKRVEF